MGVTRSSALRAAVKPRRVHRKPAIQHALIPESVPEVELTLDGHTFRLTNLQKIFWPEEGITKGDLLRYYLRISNFLLPHLQHRAMVMKRYPNGAFGKFFFQKRAPVPRPDWIEICPIQHTAGLVDFPVVRDVASLLWIVNLGCIDLNPWYARCHDVHRPDYLHFDLDPVQGTPFERVCETGLLVHEALDRLKMPNFVKTTGSRGLHVYVPIVRGPTQKEVWTFAKALALSTARLRPELVTAEYLVAKRPKGRVLVDYNQNAWGRTLASVYSVRPKPRAPVSTPVTWKEIERGLSVEDFRIENVPGRLETLGDLWRPLQEPSSRFPLQMVI